MAYGCELQVGTMFCCVVHTLVLLPAQGVFVQWDGRTNVLIAPPSACSLLCHVQVLWCLAVLACTMLRSFIQLVNPAATWVRV